MLLTLRKPIVFLLLFLLSVFPQLNTWAQINDMQSWWSLTAIGPFYEGNRATSFKFWLEGAQRLGDDSTRSTQRFLRPGVGYQLNETNSVWLGAAWIYTGIPLTRIPYSERRLWQQWLWSKTYPYSTLMQRLRLEERFLYNNPTTGWRLRDFVKMISPLAQNPQWSVVGSNELFWDLNNFVGNII